MKIVNLIEDTEGSNGCFYEHGLSFYIETAHHKLLCDTGATNAFIENARKKGIDLRAVDTVIISHGHYDHTGGLVEFVKLNEKADIYIHKSAVGEFYSLKKDQIKYIGMNKDILKLGRIIFTNGTTVLDNELSLFSNVQGRRLWPNGNKLLKRKCGESFLQDQFDHEQYLVINDNNKSLLVSGCAHNGILNILECYSQIYVGNPDYVISGFHTVRQEYNNEDTRLIAELAKELTKVNTVFYTGHCTGEYPMRIMKKIMGEQLGIIHSGDEIYI